jgi:hypothetical protein
MPPHVGQEQLQAVGGACQRLGRVVRGLLDGRLPRRPLCRLRRADLEAERLQLACELLDLVLAEVVLEHERLELRRLDEAALLGVVDERPRLLGLEKLLQLLVRQSLLNSLGRYFVSVAWLDLPRPAFL